MQPATINAIANEWFYVWTHIASQATVIALIALAAVRWMPRLSANLRYVILLLALVKFIVPPFLSSPTGLLSQWEVDQPSTAFEADKSSVISASSSTVVRSVPQSPAASTSRFTAMDNSVVELQATGDASAPFPVNAKAELNLSRPSEIFQPERSIASPLSAGNADLQQHVPRLPIAEDVWPTGKAWLLLFYCCGVMLMVLRTVKSRIVLSRIVARCDGPNGVIQSEFRQLLQSMGFRRDVRLLLSPDPVTPMAYGLARPAVIAPAALLSRMSSAERRAILAHELAHHRRFDTAVLHIQAIVLTVWWCHPLVWLLNQRVLRIREQCCDDQVVADQLSTRAQYSSALVQAVEWCSLRSRILQLSTSQLGPLTDRIARVMDPRTARSARLSRRDWFGTVLLCGLVLPGLAVQSSNAAPPTTSPGPSTTVIALPQTTEQRQPAVVPSEQQLRDRRYSVRRQQTKLVHDLANLHAAMAALQDPSAQQKEDRDEKFTEIRKALVALRSRLRPAGAFAQPDGWILAVDQNAELVYVNLGRADGLREGVTFSVCTPESFGRRRSGPPDIKGMIEIVEVLDDHHAKGRIVNQDPGQPIAVVDPVHSPIFRANETIEIVFAGRVSLNGLNRGEFRRLMSAAGARISVEVGDEGQILSGKGEIIDAEEATKLMTARTRYLVIGDLSEDEKNAKLQAIYKRTRENTEALKKRAADLGVYEISLSTFLNRIGYSAKQVAWTPENGQPFPDKLAQERSASGLCEVGGRVVDEKDRGVQATIWHSQRVGDAVKFLSTTTDTAGRFRFKNIQPDSSAVMVVAENRTYTGTYVKLQAGQTEGNLKLVVTPSATLTFKVRDQKGMPVAGAELDHISWVVPGGSRWWLSQPVLDRHGVARPQSDRNGNLLIAGIPKNVACDVVIRHKNFVSTAIDGVKATPSAHDLQMQAGVPIVIRAIDGESGKPVPDATVSISGLKAVRVSAAKVDEAGEYHVRFPPKPERITIHVRHPELATTRWASLRNGTGPALQEFKLYRRGNVQGVVTDSDSGEPCPNVSVQLIKSRAVIVGGTTDAAGRFDLSSPSGHLKVRVDSGNGYYSASTNLRDVQVKPGDTHVVEGLTAERLPIVKGSVRLADGKPAANALVIHHDFRPESMLTDENGRFEFQLMRKPYGVHVTASHLTKKLSSGVGISFEDVVAGKEAIVQLRPESSLAGTIVDDDGSTVAGADVWLNAGISYGPRGEVGTMSTSGRVASAVTDDQGRFSFAGLSRHRSYSVSAGSNTWPPGSPLRAPLRVSSKRLQLTEATHQIQPLKIPSGASSEEQLRLAKKTPAAAIVCSDWINTSPLDAESLRGKVVLLDFWATWCGPCMADLPILQMAHDSYADRGLVVIGLHHNSVSSQDVRNFITERGLNYPVGVDSATGETCGNFDVSAFPTRILIDRNGSIVTRQLNAAELLAAVRTQILYGDGSSDD